MAVEVAVDTTVSVDEITVVPTEKKVVRKTRETTRFEVVLGSRRVHVERKETWWGEDGQEVRSFASIIEFDFAETLQTQRSGITGMVVYGWLKAEFDERDPIS